MAAWWSVARPAGCSRSSRTKPARNPSQGRCLLSSLHGRAWERQCDGCDEKQASGRPVKPARMALSGDGDE
jgi:hypothetical protein